MYINLLTKLKNASRARKERVKFPYSEMDFAIAELLAREGFIVSVEKKGRMPKRIIEIRLKYENGETALQEVCFISTPGRRIYAGWRELKPVRQNFGRAVLSTPRGILTNREARKQKVGGEVLFKIW